MLWGFAVYQLALSAIGEKEGATKQLQESLDVTRAGFLDSLHQTLELRDQGSIEAVNPLIAQLQLDTKVKVLLAQPQKQSGLREMALLKQGLLSHPLIEQVATPEEARFIVWMTVCDICDDKPWLYDPKQGFNSSRVPSSKLVIIDFSDSPDTCTHFRDMTDHRTFRRFLNPAPLPLCYFKRSFVRKGFDGEYLNKSPIMLETHLEEYYPTNYAVLDQRVGGLVLLGKRDIPILCTLRVQDRQNKVLVYNNIVIVILLVRKHSIHTRIFIMQVRARVTDWLQEVIAADNITGAQVGAVTTGKGMGDVVAPAPAPAPASNSTDTASPAKTTVGDDPYMSTLRRARIIVTANPAWYEGDSRLWEGLASGAMVGKQVSKNKCASLYASKQASNSWK
jgi:hypothetical protein